VNMRLLPWPAGGRGLQFGHEVGKIDPGTFSVNFMFKTSLSCVGASITSVRTWRRCSIFPSHHYSTRGFRKCRESPRILSSSFRAFPVYLPPNLILWIRFAKSLFKHIVAPSLQNLSDTKITFLSFKETASRAFDGLNLISTVSIL